MTATLEWGSLKDTGTGITITNFVDSTATLASNKNDTTIPTSKAVSDYVDTQVGASDLDFSGDSGTGAVILASETFAVTGTTNQITTTASGTGLALSLPSTVHRDLQGNVTGNLTGDVTGNVTGNVTGDLTGNSAGTHTGAVVGNVTGDVTGDLTGTVTATSSLADGVTATSQAVADDSTKVATTAFVQDVVGTIPAGLVFQGTWNASTNTPTLASGTGTTGHFYIVSVAGTTDLDGVTDWAVGDWAVFVEQGASDQWEKVDNSSVLDGNGTGGKISKWAGSGNSVTLTDSVITESGSNIGIGEASPIYKLEVAGEAGIELYNGTGGGDVLNFRPSLGDASKFNLSISSFDHSGSGVGPADGLSLNGFDGVSISTGSNSARQERFVISQTGALKLNTYGAGTLVSDASGNITSISGGGEGGPYLPLAGGTMTGNLALNDSVKALFGTSFDLQIYHDASNSFIQDSGTGDLFVLANNLRLANADNSGQFINANNGGAVELYHNNSKKLETTSTGVTITGGWVTDGVSVAQANIEHTDNTKSTFGNGNDLSIYHDGSNSYINDTGTGSLITQTSAYFLRQGGTNNTNNAIVANTSVDLYYDNSKKLETTSAGVSVTGAGADTILTVGNTGSGGVNWSIHSASGSSPYAQSSGDFLIRNASSNVLRLGNNGNANFAGDVDLADNKKLKFRCWP